jgi:HSP20 family protein
MEETMAKPESKVPVRSEKGQRTDWHPLENLHEEINRLFEDFGRGPLRRPLRRGGFELEPIREGWGAAPAVDVVEKDKAYEITAELPGMDEKNIELKVSGGILSISGEKTDEKEEKKKGYYVSERRYGSFMRSFRVPEGVDLDKIAADFKKGVLTVTLPKKPEAQRPEKKIAIKAA